jgi:hypothetical protein
MLRRLARKGNSLGRKRGILLRTTYRDLAEFGLRFVAPEEPAFTALVEQIASLPQPFGPRRPMGGLGSAAVLLNESGKAVINFTYLWRSRFGEAWPRNHSVGNLGSGKQVDVLCGRSGVIPDLGTFFLSGSKRLITEQGVFGSNLDVLPEASLGPGGFLGAGAPFKTSGEEHGLTHIELILDVAIFEDGLCAGPDETGLIGRLTADLERQRQTSQEIVAALQSGDSVGRAFEILRPLARRGMRESPLVSMFVRQAIHRMTHSSDQEILDWFTREAEASPLPLHRPA